MLCISLFLINRELLFTRKQHIKSHSLTINAAETHMAAESPFLASPFLSVFIGLASVLLLLPKGSVAQQPYVDNRQLDCYNNAYDNITEGYTCNGPSSCRAYLTFWSQPPYDTAVTIARLLNSSSEEIVAANDLLSSSAAIPRRSLVVVPVNCSCSSPGGFYQHNATYILHDAGEDNGDGRLETYFFVANNTYQALSTCQALMSQNRYGSRGLRIGLELLVPLRCACPTEKQSSDGFKYLLTYPVARGDSVSVIAERFGSSAAAVTEANELNSSSFIYYFTPLLVPLKTEFSGIRLPPPPSPVTPPPQSPVTPPVEPPGSSRKWVFVGIGIGTGLILLILTSVVILCFIRKRRTRRQEKPTVSGSLTKYSVPKTQNSRSWSVGLSSQEHLGVKSAIESLTVYRFHELQVATENFSEANKIKGSVYRASINGDDAAIKVIKGDVSSSEINLLKKINHSNIIRLSGFCIREGNSYLVYEYAGKGSVSDWIHSDKKSVTSLSLTWKERVQIARDIADALNYLHNYITPPHVHKNVKSSNILLDSNMRAKISNFGLARILSNDDQENGDINLKLTRHVVGTQGYLPPEYIENGVITPKLDVFAFGVVILELLSGKEAATAQKKSKDSDDNNTNNVGERTEQEGDEEMLWVMISRVLEGENVREKLTQFIDPCLGKEYPMELAYAMAQLAKSCVTTDLNARPFISEVLATLSMIVSSSLEWEPFDEIHRSRSVGDSR